MNHFYVAHTNYLLCLRIFLLEFQKKKGYALSRGIATVTVHSVLGRILTF